MPWTPADFPSLTGWWDANDLSGVGDGSDVTTWPDKSGNGFDFVQRGAGNYPDKATPGGYHAVEFDRSNSESMETPNILSEIIGSTGLVACVVELSAIPTANGAWALLFGDGNTAGNAGGSFWVYAQNTSSSPFWSFDIYDGQTRHLAAPAALSTRTVLMFRRDDDSTMMYAGVNGGTEQTSAAGPPSPQTERLALGAQVFSGSGGEGLSGRLYEIVTSSTNGIADDRTNLINYLKTKWGVADTSWLTAIDPTAATVTRISFPTPTGVPTAGAGLQKFRALLRKTAGAPNPTVTIELWETGGEAALATLVSDVEITSTTGQVVEATFDASVLGTADGSAVECRIISTPGVG